MDIVSQCPLRVGKVAWQSRAGAWALTVVCKATYRLAPNESPLADEQEDIYDDDTYWDDDASRSLSVASDLSPFKPRADILVVGHAYAPQGQPARALTARLHVRDVDKSLEVWCDRGFAHTGQLLEGPRFTKMPLRYERAAGGPGTWNPAGMRFDAPPDAYGMVTIPNLQPLGKHVAWRGDTFEPTGLGPVAPAWPFRRELLSRHAAGWPYRRWFEQPLPDDIHPAFFNAAPPDQQLPALLPDERIALEGLHPSFPQLVTRLAEVRPRAAVERAGQGREEVALTCDTMLIDTDRSLCTLVWRGRIGLRQRDEAGRVLVTMETAGAGREAPSEIDEGQAFTTAVLLRPEALRMGGQLPPFLAKAPAPSTPQAAAPPPLQAPAPPPAQDLAEKDAQEDDEGAWTTLVPTRYQAALAAQRPATPFVPAGSQGSGDLARGGVIAPPSSSPAGPVEPPPKVSFAALSARFGGTVELTSPREALHEILPFKSAAGAPEPPPARLDTLEPGMAALALAREGTIADTAEEQPAAPTPSPGLPAPPPMIGPLARSNMDGAEAPAPEPAPPPPEEADAEPPAAPQPAPVKRAPADFAVEKCAALTASIARRRESEAEILGEIELEKPDWEAIQSHWFAEIRKESQRGRADLLRRFDAAYVEQLEKERGPIQVAEYARLAIAMERGVLRDALAEVSLPDDAAMRIERLWLQRIARDAALGERVLEALEKARRA